MVTAKKASTPKSAETVVAAPVKTVAAKKPTAKKAARPAVPTAAEVVATPEALPAKTKAPAKAKTGTVNTTTPALTTEQRNNYVEVAAFYIAERRGFAPGNPADDWAAAEAEVDRLIASGQFGS